MMHLSDVYLLLGRRLRGWSALNQHWLRNVIPLQDYSVRDGITQ